MFGIGGLILGIILILIGLFLTFFFPGTQEHQPPPFGAVGIFLGLILIIIGGILVFVA
ncbi:MAG: hypothetical protein JSW41_05230 [Candidatus Aenigmatarchaeota archaeon]|nr:MAG: hypothetical protein JSW41_05230 [Candidatus Aenigmarchaeota archaeon]